MFGRPLRKDEQITILTFPPHAAPAAKGRHEPFRRMNRVLDKAVDNPARLVCQPQPKEFGGLDEKFAHGAQTLIVCSMKDVLDRKFDDAVDEAMEQAHKKRT